jgi:uncharacterized membrane-anchored protein YhcB (DUF1043 family)
MFSEIHNLVNICRLVKLQGVHEDLKNTNDQLEQLISQLSTAVAGQANLLTGVRSDMDHVYKVTTRLKHTLSKAAGPASAAQHKGQAVAVQQQQRVAEEPPQK